jgi:hypothetical protein
MLRAHILKLSNEDTAFLQVYSLSIILGFIEDELMLGTSKHIQVHAEVNNTNIISDHFYNRT